MFRWLGRLRRPLRWVFLLLLPFNTLAYVYGLFEGFSLHHFREQSRSDAIQNFDRNVINARDMDYFSVPGGPGIHDVGVAPYYVPQIRDPSDWWERLGLKRFDIQPRDVGVPIDRFADLGQLYRRTRAMDAGKPWHHWIYMSGQPFMFDDLFLDEWDAAFNQLLQYHYRTPAVGNAQFHYLQCPGNFLCDVWMTRGPALVHFTTQTPELWPDYENPEKPPVPLHAPVSVRVIELPVENMQDLAILPGTFPSPFEQMRSLTGDEYSWERYLVHTEMEQIMIRIGEICTAKAYELRPTFGRLHKLHYRMQDWLEEHADLLYLGVLLVRMLGLLTSAGALHVKTLAGEFWQSFLGTGEEDKLAAEEREMDLAQREWDAIDPDGSMRKQLQGEDNFMAQMLRDFIDAQGGKDFEDLVNSSPEGKQALENMWDIVRRKPESEPDCEGDECQ